MENATDFAIIYQKNATYCLGEARMLKRKIEKTINDWLQSGTKALLVYGVRQAGKTFSIRNCLTESKIPFVEFNLIENPEVLQILQNTTNPNDIILKFSLYAKQKLIPNKTVIFLDEIQLCKEFVTILKFLVEDGRFRYILSGSLLGVEITNIKSAPVGYLQTMSMYPLDFEEFLQIFNVSHEIISRLGQSYSTLTPVDESIHKKLMDIFRLYLIIGGMPAAVEAYRKTNNIDDVITEHEAIVELYKLDFTRYESEDKKLLLQRAYELIPAELNAKNKRYKVADMNKNFRFAKIEDTLTWLCKTGVALPVYNITEPTLPLLINTKHSLLKLFMSDIGLLTTVYGKATKLKIINGESDINKGAIYENVVAQELVCHGFPLYYYNSKKRGELDFIVEKDCQVFPIEVKSGKGYERHSALNNLLNEENYNISHALVFSNENIKKIDKVIYLPIYMSIFLQKDDDNFTDISLARFLF